MTGEPKQRAMQVDIRAATDRDIPDVIRMINALATHHGDTAEISEAELMRDAYSDRPWLHLLVAQSGDTMLGYAALFGTVQLHMGRRDMVVHHMYTDPDYRGQGIGQALVEACKQEARAQSCAYLEVGTDPDNLAAQAFYLAAGFKRRIAYPPRFALAIAD
ncbi:MAG: GNAT family N-acetyltransferase [Loktanella sp.]|nr:GNAT family N-acetyltransferase [Loktanella sp.]